MMVYLQSFSDIWNLPPVTRDVIKEICSKYCDTTWDTRKQEISCFCDKYEMSVEMEKKMISENWGVLKGFCRFHVIYESFGEQNTGSQCFLLKRNLILVWGLTPKQLKTFQWTNQSYFCFWCCHQLYCTFSHLHLFLLPIFALTLTFISTGKLCQVHIHLSESTCLMFILLLNHQSISIGCWAVSLEQIRVKHPARSQIDRKLFADDHALVTSKFLYIFEQHHPLVKALASSHTQWDDGEVIHAALQGHHPHPECFMYLLSGCTVTERLPHLINIHVLI